MGHWALGIGKNLFPISPSASDSCSIEHEFSRFFPNSMIHLSPAATSEIERLKCKQQPQILFRLQVKPGGCSGFIYDIAFDQAVKDEDQTFDVNNIQLVIDKESIKYLDGLTLDYSEDLMGGGFRFHNPIATATCSCGNSFSI